MDDYFAGVEDMRQIPKLAKPLLLHWFTEIDSTNTATLHQAGLAEGAIIAADLQRAGKGRLGRTWQSPPGVNLYFSLVLYPKLPKPQWGGFSLTAGVALAQTLSELGVDVNLKWPNDLQVAGRKLGGILLESKGDRLVIGVGLNVNQTVFSDDLLATSLKTISGKAWRRDLLLSRLAEKLFELCKTWDQGHKQILAAWRQYDVILGQRIVALAPHGQINGLALDVGDNGELYILGDDGIRHCVHSGEVSIKK